MITTSKLLAALKKAHGDCSDYRIAKILDVAKTTVSRWSCGHGYMSEETARKAAQILGWDETYTIACIHAEGMKGSETYPIWKEICDKLEPEKLAA